jgi:transposase InsO family protein
LRSIRAWKRRVGLTKAQQSAYFAPHRLQQDLPASRKNEKWVTDTTYIPTREGWLDLLSVLDFFSRQIVGCAMSVHHDADLATGLAQPAPGLIGHSDRGSEFAKFHDRAAKTKIRLNMSSTGSCCEASLRDGQAGSHPRGHLRLTAGSTHGLV